MFIFKGKNSNDMGVYVREENFLGKAPMRYDSIEIEGKHGADLVELGYQNFEGTLNDVVIMNDNFDEVLHWLSGTGELIYMGKKTRIHFLDAYQIAKHKKTFSIPFIREPFWYALEDEYSEAWGANLIPDGWNNFSPYGSGVNYVENWNFENDENHWSGFRMASTIVDNTLRCEITSTNTPKQVSSTVSVFHKNVLLRLKIKGNCTVTIYNWGNVSDLGINSLKLNNDWNIFEFPFNVIDIKEAIVIRIFADKTDIGDWFEIDWIQITPVDNQHLVVEKTPLENGLTRIKTWGGNSYTKLISSRIQNNIARVVSFYLTDNNFIRVWDSYTSNSFISSGNYDGQIIYGMDSRSTRLDIQSNSIYGNLDFIASTPTIVEGDTPPTWEADENPRIINEGTAPSKPLIKLTKGTTNTCEFEVNDVYFKYHFNNDDHVLVDCEEMEATYEGFPRNRHLTIGFEFPTLKVGDNVVKKISGDANIEFKRKDRWL